MTEQVLISQYRLDVDEIHVPGLWVFESLIFLGLDDFGWSWMILDRLDSCELILTFMVIFNIILDKKCDIEANFIANQEKVDICDAGGFTKKGTSKSRKRKTYVLILFSNHTSMQYTIQICVQNLNRTERVICYTNFSKMSPKKIPDAPIFSNLPPVAGALSWARSLRTRLQDGLVATQRVNVTFSRWSRWSQEPMPKILTYNELMKEVPESFRVTRPITTTFSSWITGHVSLQKIWELWVLFKKSRKNFECQFLYFFFHRFFLALVCHRPKELCRIHDQTLEVPFWNSWRNGETYNWVKIHHEIIIRLPEKSSTRFMSHFIGSGI